MCVSNTYRARPFTFDKSSHPFVNDERRRVVQKKLRAAATPFLKFRSKQCGDIISKAFQQYQCTVKEKLGDKRTSSKSWWILSASFSYQSKGVSLTPWLFYGNIWQRDSISKANAFASCFQRKVSTQLIPFCTDPDLSCIQSDIKMRSFIPIRTKRVQKLESIARCCDWS